MNRKAFISVLGLGAATMASCRDLSGSGKAAVLPEYDSSAPHTYWSSVRRAFPLSNERVYLNSGGLGPSPSVVIDAVCDKSNELQRLCESGHSLFGEARVVAAQFLGADENEICFTRNATESNSIIASGLTLEKGDEVIFESHAHPGGSFPWLNLQKRIGVKVKVFEPDPDSMEGNLERIKALITPRTRVIQVSHITAPTGILFDVKQIADLARERGIWFHVDGAQSSGMIPVDLHKIGCHSYATSGHKWMGGPRGTGILYIAKDSNDAVECSHVGAYSNLDYELPDVFTYVKSAKRHEYGTRNAETVEGLRVAMEFQKSIGIERIEAYGQGLATYLQAGLSKIDGISVLTPKDKKMYRSITTFKSDKIEFAKLTGILLRDYQLRCRQVSEQALNAIRVSTHIYNSKDDCDRVIDAVQKATQSA